MTDKKEEIKDSQEFIDLKKGLEQTLESSVVEEMLQGNEIQFPIEDTIYRVTKPSFGQKQIVYKKRVEKFTELLQDKKLLLEKDLKKQYKDRGIDIEAMQASILELERKKQDLQMKLGEAIVNQVSDTELMTLKKEIDQVQSDQLDVALEKNMLMEFSIEQQIFVFVYVYLTFLIAEKKTEDDKWVRVWNKFEDFENESEELVKQITYYASLLLKDELAG